MVKKNKSKKHNARVATHKKSPSVVAVKHVAKHATKPRRQKFFSLHYILFFILMVVGLIGFATVFLYSPIREDSSIEVVRGDAVNSVAKKLNEKNMIIHPIVFKALVRMSGGMIKAGVYDISAGESVYRIASQMSTGRVAQTSITIPEGFTIIQARRVIENNPDLRGSITVDVAEGDLFPSTYVVPKGESRDNVIKIMTREMDGWKNSYERGSWNIPLKNWNEVLTLASIVQRETMISDEMPRVASVYYNRLKIGMKLQADPTVVYILTNKLGHMEGKKLYQKHLMEVNSPYNTYRNKGLPPGPIANPGAAAIQAVLQPANTDYLYFVADGSGGHVFSKTLEEHNSNHAKWREIRAKTVWQKNGDSK